MSSGSNLVGELAELSDEELVGRMLDRGGRDERPFGELFRRHKGLVWRVALGFFGNVQDAEDMTQDVFFTAHRKLAQFKGEASFRTWLHRITTNRCKNELRRRSRRLRTVSQPLEEAAAAAANGSPGPEAVTVRGRRLQRLALALESLPPEDRRVLQLVDLESAPYKEVAEVLEVSLGAVKMRVLRARARLREAFDRNDP
jgi:RNA polymerase sigma-70 factor (ECF subfamily)